jgi:uroporphyrin-III C-methyltransferase
MARKDAQMISVGKTAHHATISQHEINEVMLAHVREGRRVCRLKGGDPFVFGRGGEEVQALAAAGLPFQVVPGVSAALGCAAYAGIPLTHRGLSSSVTFATARLDGDRVPDWDGLVRPDHTLVLYMSVGSIAETAAQLVAHGLGEETPVALIENGTTEKQRVLRGTLATIAHDAFKARIRAPAIIIVGATAGLGNELEWFAADSDPSVTSPDQELSWRRDFPLLNHSTSA